MEKQTNECDRKKLCEVVLGSGAVIRTLDRFTVDMLPSEGCTRNGLELLKMADIEFCDC